VGRSEVVCGFSVDVGAGEVSVGIITWVLDGTVSTVLVGGRLAVVGTGEAPPAQAEIIKTTPRMINVFIRVFCKVDLLRYVW